MDVEEGVGVGVEGQSHTSDFQILLEIHDGVRVGMRVEGQTRVCDAGEG